MGVRALYFSSIEEALIIQTAIQNGGYFCVLADYQTPGVLDIGLYRHLGSPRLIVLDEEFDHIKHHIKDLRRNEEITEKSSNEPNFRPRRLKHILHIFFLLFVLYWPMVLFNMFDNQNSVQQPEGLHYISYYPSCNIEDSIEDCEEHKRKLFELNARNRN